jgi:hypothetical protein
MIENIWRLGFQATLASFLLPVWCESLPLLRRVLQIFLEIQVSILPSIESCIDLLGNKSPLKQIEAFKPLFLIVVDAWTESSHSLLAHACDRAPFTPSTHKDCPMVCSCLCPRQLCFYSSVSGLASSIETIHCTLSCLNRFVSRLFPEEHPLETDL